MIVRAMCDGYYINLEWKCARINHRLIARVQSEHQDAPSASCGTSAGATGSVTLNVAPVC
jgi:hypothetical protein